MKISSAYNQSSIWDIIKKIYPYHCFCWPIHWHKYNTYVIEKVWDICYGYLGEYQMKYYQYLNYSVAETGIFQESQVHAMAADALTPSITWASAAIVFIT